VKLRQLRYIWEVAQHDLNVTTAAAHLHTSQPGVSKQIRLLEDELGIDIFVRRGKQLVRVTPVGEIVLGKVDRILRELDGIAAAAHDYRTESRGTLSIATTHTQVRYALPAVLPKLRAKYPEVSLHLRQGTTEEISEMAAAGVVDFAIAPEAVEHRDLVMMPCYRWNRCVVVPPGHPLAERRRLAAADLEAHPIVTYDAGFRERLPMAGSGSEDDDDANDGLTIALSAVDTDVIKTYVRLGFGIGIIATMAYDPAADADLVAIDASNLFTASTVHIGCRRGTYMRQFMLDFVGWFAPHLTPDVVEQAFAAPEPTAIAALFEAVRLPQR